MDIFKILSYGVIGLGFFLALFSYRLLLREQEKDSPRKSILQAIYVFMSFAILLSVIGVSSELLRANSPQRNPKPLSNQSDAKYYLGIWKGTASDTINSRVNDSVQIKYRYDLTFEFEDRNDSIIVTGSYTPIPMTAITPPLPVRTFSGYAIQDGDFLRILYATKATPQPTGKGLGVFCFRFSSSGRQADGYYISRALSDAQFVVGRMVLGR